MKKIMYNDKFGLTDAVLQGTKTVTRRIITPQPTYSELDGVSRKNGAYGIGFNNPIDAHKNFIIGTEYNKSCNRYRIGEKIAIAQRYEDIVCGAKFNNDEIFELQKHAGHRNKMFVEAELMPHQIEIIDVMVERLQDITDEDCIKEGIASFTKDKSIYKYGIDGWRWQDMKCTAREAFAVLIDKVSGKGTWDTNPYVFRYEFKLIK